MLCKECGYQFPPSNRERKAHEAHAADVPILSGEIVVESYDVTDATFQVWTKRTAGPNDPRTVRITYRCTTGETVPGTIYDSGALYFSEWVCPEHTGYARAKFEKWWTARASSEFPMPDRAEDVCEADFMGFLRKVKRITVKRVAGKNYPEIVGYEYGDFPEREIENGREATSDDMDYDDLPF